MFGVVDGVFGWVLVCDGFGEYVYKNVICYDVCWCWF